MALEEVITGLQNAISRGESLQRAMQTLIVAGYNAQEVQEAARQVNMGVIGNIGVVQETQIQKAQPAQIIPPKVELQVAKLPPIERKEEKSQTPVAAEIKPNQYQKLPVVESATAITVAPQTQAKKKLPKWLIISIIIVGLILISLVLLGILGPKILASMKK